MAIPLSEQQRLLSQLDDVLTTRFQLPTFRSGQREAITTLFEQGCLLCIQPTGHGKSLLYQLPSVLFPGITLVISPLLALMRDQIQQLSSRFSITAATINSDQEDDENQQVKQRALRGELKILFIAPEKLDRLDYVDFLLQLPITLLVIDEAHCISTWGHDFRPSYRQIIYFIQQAYEKNTELLLLALTATANAQTEDDIKRQLSLNNSVIPVRRQSMDRPNISLTVIPASGLMDKLIKVKQLVNQLLGIGLIYCSTREHTEIVAEYLQTFNCHAVAYHAGLSPDKKKVLQDKFLNNQYQVIVATNALGMGIDKQDVRFILHFDMPGSITAYYQEVGRCGRDGNKAHGILLFDVTDKRIHEYFINSSQPSPRDFITVLDVIRCSEFAPGLVDIKRVTGMHPTRLSVVMAELIEQKYLMKKKNVNKQVYYCTDKQTTINLVRYEKQLQIKERELNEMLAYGHNDRDCLMRILRKALGDKEAAACGCCYNCADTFLTFNDEDLQAREETQQWIIQRTLPINLGKSQRKVEEGVSLLDGKIRTQAFINFMHDRQKKDIALNSQLVKLIQRALGKLRQIHHFTAVVCLPSATWAQRLDMAQIISHHLDVPLLVDYLIWQNDPAHRQGELLNNDQRRFNVNKNMTCQRGQTVAPGAVLLFDDYIGSGATMKEAIRVLRTEARIPNIIVPLTIATIRWRLGKGGMI